MRKKQSRAKPLRRKTESDTKVKFRERRLSDIVKGLKHPKPIPGYKSTLPGPPGWQYKQDPGA